ncbi:MAG: hypothetical protein ABFC24_12720 [Methanoregulaceae archaeon]
MSSYMGGMIASYLASPEGRKKVHEFLSSPDGKDVVRNYLSTPGGQQLARDLLSAALESLDLPEDLKVTIRAALEKKE